MSWWWRSRTAGPPTPTGVASHRRHAAAASQLSPRFAPALHCTLLPSLLPSHLSSPSPCLTCRSLLEVGCRLQDGTLTSLRISLPPGFPSDRPALSITSPVRHPWVDAVGRLNFPLLERWGAPNVRLAAVVADAFKGLGGTPAPAPATPASPMRPQQVGQHPPPTAQSSAASLAASMASAASGPASMSPAPSGSSAAGPQRTRVVPIPATFAEVGQMGEEQLARTLADERAYNQLVGQLAASLNLWQVRSGGFGRLCLVAGMCSSVSLQLSQGTAPRTQSAHMRHGLQPHKPPSLPPPCPQVVDKLKGETRELAAANLAKSEEQGEIRNQVRQRMAGSFACDCAGERAVWSGVQAQQAGAVWSGMPQSSSLDGMGLTAAPPHIPTHPPAHQMAIIRSGEYAPAKAQFDDKWARQQVVLSKLSPEVLIRRYALGLRTAGR